MTKIDFLLHESALGYALFKVVHQQDTVGLHLKEVQKANADLAKFGKMVELVSFAPWRSVGPPARAPTPSRALYRPPAR